MSEPKEHELKCWPPYFADICEWSKSFELRKADRDYKVGDTLWLREWDPTTERYTDSECVREIGYILLGDAETSEWGLAPGYCILGLKPYDNRAKLRARITALEALLREAGEALLASNSEIYWLFVQAGDRWQEIWKDQEWRAQSSVGLAYDKAADLAKRIAESSCASALHEKLKAEAPALEAKQ